MTATGAAPLYYQWRLNASNILNATNATLALNDARTSDAGGYDVIVSNAVGSVTSQVATLTRLSLLAEGWTVNPKETGVSGSEVFTTSGFSCSG